MKRPFNLTLIALLVSFVFLFWAASAKSHYQPGEHNVKHAICLYFKQNCYAAIIVAKCESRLQTTARNGQYRGLFQMGSRERQIYGHGLDPWSQARAAFAYFRAVGYNWRPWDYRCRP